MSITSWVLSTGEKLGSKVISKFFWPPCSAMALIIQESKILVVRTDDYIMLPGGILEQGESLRECAVREVKEETGLDVKLEKEVFSDTKDFGGVEKIFTGEVAGGTLEGSWEGSPEWISLNDLDREDWRWDRDIQTILDSTEH